jgi:hypothetical protein
MAITTNGKVPIGNIQGGTSSDIAALISDESGTGFVAFTTSPTFTTPALGTPSALVLTNATGTPSSITLTNGTGLPVSGITASTSTAIGVGSVELGHATDTTLARVSSGVVSIEGVNIVTTSSTDTLTNKTLTTPIISSISNTGTLTLPTSTDTLVGRNTTDTLTNKTLTSPVISTITNTGTLTLPTTTGTVALTSDITVTDTSTSTLSNKTLTAPKFADLGFIADANGNELIILDTVASAVNEVTLANAATGGTPTLTASGGDTDISLDLVAKGTGTVKAGGVNVVTISSTDTLTNKTLTSPTINTATFKDGVVRGLEEDVNVVASAATGTINFDVDTASIWYYTTNATANHTLNFRYSSGVSLNTALAVGDSITLVWLNTNGATAYYPNVIQIDGNTVTPKVPAAISSGNASAIDAYTFTIIKTASATFTVLETQQKFA